jgi:hypothetical protein
MWWIGLDWIGLDWIVAVLYTPAELRSCEMGFDKCWVFMRGFSVTFHKDEAIRALGL